LPVQVGIPGVRHEADGTHESVVVGRDQ
jgi:hypothetical protein